MAFLVGLRRHCSITLPVLRSNDSYSWCHLLNPNYGTQWFSSRSGSNATEFPAENAYEILGVSETSSFAEIKASFHKLAKETHPDLAESKDDSSSSKRFIQILAAYEILSDSEKRTCYDIYLLSQRKIMQKPSGHCSTLHIYKSHATIDKHMEVVEWLKWYRVAINDILAEKKVVVGTRYLDVLEADFYSAIHAAYYGPVIESMDLLPDRFEAEERSVCETTEVLHLVSGQDLFGMVCLVDNVPELSSSRNDKLTFFSSLSSDLCQSIEKASSGPESDGASDFQVSRMQGLSIKSHVSDAYKDLELHLCGKVVAMATRVPPKSCHHGITNEDDLDHIHVFLNSGENSVHFGRLYSNYPSSDGLRSKIPLGTISGLGTSPEEGSCFIYDISGTKTHVIMKHRTLMVKHMHWYRMVDDVCVCECRCSRARLPPSKFWLFEPRCSLHDIGGWYIETFGRDKKGQTVPSQRYWDGVDAGAKFDERLHPAIYLLALAYRTLDLEYAKRRKQATRDFIEGKLLRVLSWCKKLV